MENVRSTPEDHFNIIDAELDLRANILFQEVEKALQEHTKKTDEGNKSNANQNLSDITGDENGLTEFSSIQEKSIPSRPLSAVRGNTSTNEPELKYLRAKIKILATEVERQRVEYRRKTGEWQEREKEMLAIRHDRDKQTQQNVTLHQQLSKLNVTIKERTERFQRTEAENVKLTSELQCVRKEVKTANQKASTLETRLNRMTEECESLKAELRTTNLKHKEDCDEHRRILEQHTAITKRCEKQRNELALAFRRQMLLLHNLQQQKEYLVAGAALKEAENQFDQLLTAKNTRKSTANTK